MEGYPLLTEPHFKDYIWGGRNLETKLGKALPAEGIWAESWEIVDHPEHQSVVKNGHLAGSTLREISRLHSKWLFGDRALQSVPLLLKYLDCQRVLSVQVHPDDTYGHEMTPPDLGKTEAWYIISAEPGAVLYAGLRSDVTLQDLATAMAIGNCEECLHTIHPKAGDCVFIPAGTVHALGAGLLVAEIQQASNTTFRLFDWNRLGHDGQPRPLHIDQALEVIDFESGPVQLQQPRQLAEGHHRLVSCDKFVLERFSQPGAFDLENQGQLQFVTVTQGAAEMQWKSSAGVVSQLLQEGMSAILPASLPAAKCELGNNACVLKMFLP